MKKIFLLFALFIFSVSVFSQGYGVNFTVATPATKAQFLIPKYNTLKVTSTHVDYSVLKDIPAGTLISTAIADVTWLYPVGSTTSSTATITTLTSTTATITSLTATSATLGGKALTTKNTNGGTYAGSLTLATGDSLIAPVVSATTVAATTLAAGKLSVASDTAVTDPIYTIAVKGAHVYVKIATTGASSARWKQIDN